MNDQTLQLILLRYRSAVADKEFAVACANHDTAKFGAWQCDWNKAMREAQEGIDAAESAFEARKP